MRLRIWGCRGSLASPGPDTVKYGGNTSCVHVAAGGDVAIILDSGTGIRELGLQGEVREARSIHLFLSHLHLDHLEGIGFFSPLWDPSTELHIWGPRSPERTLQQRIGRLLSPPLFPLRLRDVPCDLTFHDAPEEEVIIGGLRILASPVSHQGPALGYRIAQDGSTLAYIPDHEPTRGGTLRAIDPWWVSGYEVAHDADLLLHDSQYTEKEYPEKIGWGHSSVEHVVDFAKLSRVRQLIMFHHDPLHTDEILDAHGRRAVELWGSEGDPPVLAREGMELEL